MPSTSAPASISVVLVDDSEDLLFLVRGALERSGQFRVVATAADGQQAIETARTHQPDLVLLDIAMPVMDGMQALPLIRAECPAASIVMLSAFGDASGMPQRAMAMGANGYLHKNGRLKALPEQLRVIVGGVIAERAARHARDAAQHATPGAAAT
jgi:DNA-binding NarL/FixJ family response regulator